MKVDIPNFNQARVLVVGDVMLDRYWSGSSARISSEAPVPVVKITNCDDRPGGAANVALNIASLGGQVTLLGITGDDDVAENLDTGLSAMDVICRFIRNTNASTITKLRVLSHNQQLLRLDFEESLHHFDKAELTNLVEQNIRQHHLLLLSDHDKGTLSNISEIIVLAKKNNVPVIVAPKGTDFSRYKGATLLTPNLAEFEEIVGPCKNEAELVSKGKGLVAELDLQALLITRSEQGMTLIRANEEELHLPTQAQEIYDVTGVGDTVIATLALAIGAGSSFSEASALANIAAGLVIGKIGTSTVSEVEIAQAISTGQTSGSGVVNEEQLNVMIAQARKNGEKIVMTNGCFDILHAGHVTYLSNASKLGDRLIIAVNDDESVKRLKGNGRPVNPKNRRMAVLASLDTVDWVVSFSEDTPQRLIANLLPNVLVKGGDYKVEDIAGAKEVIAAGGEVQVLNFEKGTSTSEVINTIRLED